MRKPPDLGGRKGPPQCHLRQGPNHRHQLTKHTQAGRAPQDVVYFPRRGSKSLQAIARQLRDDGFAPVELRTFAVGVAHRLRYGGKVDPAEERLLLRLSAERRRQAALGRVYR